MYNINIYSIYKIIIISSEGLVGYIYILNLYNIRIKY